MESKNRNVVFRGAMNGYNKKDVNEYIIRLSHDYYEKEQQLKSEIHKFELAAKSAEDIKLRLEKDLDEQKSNTDAIKSQLNEQIAKYAMLSEENKRLASTINDIKSANAALRAKLDYALSNEAEGVKSNCSEKRSFSGSMSIDLFSSSGNTTSEKSDKAIIKSEALRSILERIKQSIKSAADCSSEEFSSAVSELRISAGSATGIFTKAADLRADEISERVDNILSELVSSIDSEMDKIDKLLTE